MKTANTAFDVIAPGYQYRPENGTASLNQGYNGSC